MESPKKYVTHAYTGARPTSGTEQPLASGTWQILANALSGERISDADALALLESRHLVAVGRVANELRARRTDPDRITFIVDRNINYTNICYTDCDFCAFYRSPGDRREGYLLPKPVIFKKIEETLALGGTGLLMQGGHHPDLGIDYYEDLSRACRRRDRHQTVAPAPMKRSSGTTSSSPTSCASSRNVYSPARSRGPNR